MARKHEAEKYLRCGQSPSEIAESMGISLSSVIQYLRTRVGEGGLRLSDIYFSFPAPKRKLLQQLVTTRDTSSNLDSHGIGWEELDLFESLWTRHTFAGDMYEQVSNVEIGIHSLVRTTLEQEYGLGEDGWWREGIPTVIRSKCASRREEDDHPSDDKYAYTDLIDLAKVIIKNWSLFQRIVPEPYMRDRKSLEKDFSRLNRIRNTVMHPVKQRKWTEEDFQFVRTLDSTFGASDSD